MLLFQWCLQTGKQLDPSYGCPCGLEALRRGILGPLPVGLYHILVSSARSYSPG